MATLTPLSKLPTPIDAFVDNACLSICRSLSLFAPHLFLIIIRHFQKSLSKMCQNLHFTRNIDQNLNNSHNSLIPFFAFSQNDPLFQNSLTWSCCPSIPVTSVPSRDMLTSDTEDTTREQSPIPSEIISHGCISDVK